MPDASRPTFGDLQIEMAHGAGGSASRRLLEGLLVPLLSNPALNALGDSAILDVNGQRLAFTCDSFVVKPLTFPGGSIGRLAVHGTLNDLLVSGALPVALLASFILEAGFPGEALRRHVEALAEAARGAGVPVVGGDTKVVENGKGDGLYITTSGIGIVRPGLRLGPDQVRPGDRVLLSGPFGDHGITILLARGEVDLEADLESDSRPLTPLVSALLEAVPEVRWMRDPTRGGLASALNELSQQSSLAVILEEKALPVRAPFRGACELLGLDPLQIANEGQFLAVVPPQQAELALDALRGAPGGEEAAMIGEIRESPAGLVIAETDYGGSRIVDMLIGDPLPRIC